VRGNPVTVATGYSVRRLSYDGDRLARTVYLDTKGGLVNVDRGYATIEATYADDGSENERRYLDANGIRVKSGCHGRFTPELVAELSSRAAQVRECYEALLRDSGDVNGRLLFELSVDPSGVVARAEAITDEIGAPSFTHCVLRRLRRPYEQRPADGCAYVRLPLNFVDEPAVPAGEALPAKP
jgi:hypothetical protein